MTKPESSGDNNKDIPHQVSTVPSVAKGVVDFVNDKIDTSGFIGEVLSGMEAGNIELANAIKRFIDKQHPSAVRTIETVSALVYSCLFMQQFSDLIDPISEDVKVSVKPSENVNPPPLPKLDKQRIKYIEEKLINPLYMGEVLRNMKCDNHLLADALEEYMGHFTRPYIHEAIRCVAVLIFRGLSDQQEVDELQAMFNR